MGVRMGYVATSEQKRDPRDAIDLLQRSGYALPNLNDARCRGGGKVFEVGVVLARDYLDMARTDRVRVEECDYELILVDQLRSKLARSDAAEHTRGRNHLGDSRSQLNA
jgi:hypothetical protein